MISADIHQRLIQIDPDRYRAAMLADKAAQERLIVIYGFHSELAKIPELVSETMIGEIRYQWWRDVIDDIYSWKAVRAHEITTPLAQLISDIDLPRFWVDRLIDARARDLDPTPFKDMAAAQEYARMTSGVLAQISCFVLNADFDSDAALLAGEAWGLTGLARAYRYYHTGMLSQLDYADILSATEAAYYSAKQALKPVPADVMPALAYMSTIPAFIKKMRHRDFDPKTAEVYFAPPFKHIRMILSALSGRI